MIEDTIKRLKEAKFARERAEATAASTNIKERVVSTQLFLFHLSRVGLWVYRKIVYPIGSYLYKGPVKWSIKNYLKYIWTPLVYKKPDKYGQTKFSTTRAALVCLLTLIIFSGYRLYWDTIIYGITSEHHVSYLNNSQEVVSQHNVHAVRGCDEKPVCNELESIYYRADPDLFNQLWSLFHHGTFFFPDNIAAAVPPTTHKCYVHTYGFRWKWLVRNWDIYPEILQVKCFPLESGK